MHLSKILFTMAAASSIVSAAPNPIQERDDIETKVIVMTTDDTMNLEIPKVETVAIVPGPPGSSPSRLPNADGTAETTKKRAISPEMTTALINAFVEITKSVSVFVKNAQEDSNLRRQQFPRQIVARMAASDPDFSYIIVNTDYVFVGDKAAQQVVTYDPTFGFKVTFDVFAFTVGTFNLKGDGTWKNFAAALKSNCQVTNAGMTITCV